MTYLLQGLPPDLTDQEVYHLQSALPKALNSVDCIEASTNEQRVPSVLHRSVAKMVISLCLLVRLILPWIKHLLALAHSYERTHHMTGQALAASMTTVDSVGRRSMGIARTAMNNQLVMETVTYCIDGVCGGLNEGLGESIKAIEARDRP